MLACDDMASLYQYRFLCGGYLQKRSKRAAEYKTYLLCFQHLVPVSPGEKAIDLAGLLKQLGHSLLKCIFCHSCFRLQI